MNMKKFTKKMLAIVAAGYDNGNGNAGNGDGRNNSIRHNK